MLYGMDPTYILVIVGAALCALASAGVSSTFSKYAKVASSARMTGAQAARIILDRNGLQSVKIEHVRGSLTDHYDPSKKVLRLSDVTYDSSSVAAIGVAAHECGHAVQDKLSYAPLRIRAALVPAANFGSNFGLPIVILSIAFGWSQILTYVGIGLFMFGVLFQIVTLPVEFNASRRALKMVENYGIVSAEERVHCQKVLGAAALTYVASAVSALLQLLRLLILSQSRRRR